MELLDTGLILYLYHQLQVFGLMGIGYLTWLLSGKGDNIRHNSIFFTVITVIYHLSLLYLKTTPLLYFWVCNAIFHYLIHIREDRTIAESKILAIDELWHFTQQNIVLYYLYSNGRPYQYYFAFMMVYYALFYLSTKYKQFISPLYFWASTMTVVFILSIRDNGPYLWLALPFFIVHIFTSWVITYSNTLGRIFLDVNIAGCTFMSEAILLYLMYNGIY